MGVQSLVQSAGSNRGVTTAISLVVDRSASMSPYLHTVTKSIFDFISTQAESRGKAYLSISQFDDAYDDIFKNIEIKKVDARTFEREYRPRGMTAIMDAFVRAIEDMETHLSEWEGRAKPKRVVVALITDGYDNASTNSVERVRKLIEEKQNQGWDFLFLGVDEYATDLAQQLGISEKKSAQYDMARIGQGMQLLSDKVSQVRKGKSVEITAQERLALLEGPKKDEL